MDGRSPHRLSGMEGGHVRKRALSVWIVLTLGLILSALLFQLLYKGELERRRQIFKDKAQPLLQRFPERLEGHILALDSLRRFHNGSESVEREEFNEFVIPILKRSKDVKSLQWAPRVPLAERGSCEELARKDGLKGFQFMELSAQGGLVPAGRRDEYYPVLYCEPLAGNEVALGLDMGSEPSRRRLVERARDSGEAAASAKVRLLQNIHGVIVCLPVYKYGAPVHTVEERRESMSGLMVAILDTRLLVDALVEGMDAKDVCMELDDLSAPSGERTLYASPCDPDSCVRGLEMGKAFSFGGREWSLTCRASSRFVEANPIVVPWLALLAGLLLTLSLAFAVARREEQLGFLSNLLLGRRIPELREAISIRWLMGAALAFALALPFAAFLIWIRHHYADIDEEACRRLAEQTDMTWRGLVEWNSSKLSCLARNLELDKDIADAWERRDRKELLARAKPVFDLMRESLGVGMLNFIEPDGKCFLRVHDPDTYGDVLRRETVSEAMRLDRPATGIQLGLAGRMGLRHVRPWGTQGGAKGFVELGVEASYMSGKIGKALNADIVPVLFKRHLERAQFEAGKTSGAFQGDWDDCKDFVVMKSLPGGMPAGLKDIRLEQFEGAGAKSFPLSFNGKSWGCRLVRVKDCVGRELGGFIVMRDLTASQASERRTVLTTAIGAALLALLLFIVVSSLAARIERRLLTAVIAREREEEARGEMQERLSATLHSIGDGVISTGTDGVVADMNMAAEAMTGWKASEARGRHIKEVFKVVNAKTREEVEIPVERVLREGVIVGLANHAALIAKDGSERQIADSSAPIRMKDNVIGTVLVFSDVTESYRMRESIARSEERLKSIFRAVPSGIGTALDRIIKEGNERLFEMTGYPEAELIGSCSRMLYVSEEEFQRVGSQYEVARERGITTLESRWRRKDGNVMDVIISLSVIDPSDSRQGVIFSALDITNRKKAELELRQSEARFHSLFDNMAEGVALHKLVRDTEGRPVEYVITEVNAQFERILGIPREAAIGKRSMEAYHTGSPPYLEAYAEVVASGKPARFEIYFEGQSKFFDVSAAPWGDGGFATIFSDITQRKAAENALKKSEENYRTLIENIDLGISLIDADYRIVMTNRATSKVFNKPAEAFIGRKCHEEYEKRDSVCPHCPGKLAMETGQPVEVETHGILDDGRSILVRVKAFAIKDDSGKPLGFVELIEDISEKRKAEELQRKLEQQLTQAHKMESMGRLAGGLAHDFNNMLTPILGYGGMLLGGHALDEAQRAKLDHIVKAALRARDLTKRLLVFGRKQSYDIKPIDLNKVLTAFEGMLRSTIREDISIVKMLADDLGPIDGDEGLIEQVVLNLALNAQDAMPDGGTLLIKTENIRMDGECARRYGNLPEGDCVMMTFSDNGTGMDKATLERIFEPFFTTKEVGKGTGLGLSMVYGIVRQLRGGVSVYSEPGKGSVFSLYFPRAAKAASEKGPEEAQERRMALPSGTETILVAEDQEGARKLACEILRMAGYSVLEAESGESALEVAGGHAGAIHLLLSDVVMPGINGKELYKRLSASREGLKVIYMSGYANNAPGLRGILEPGVNFIQKPFTVDTIISKVREVLASPSGRAQA